MSRVVNAAAFRALDALFPMGQRSRRIVSLLFRLWFHPTEWPRQAFMASRSSTMLTLRSVRFTYRCASCKSDHTGHCISLLAINLPHIHCVKVVDEMDRLCHNMLLGVLFHHLETKHSHLMGEINSV